MIFPGYLELRDINECRDKVMSGMIMKHCLKECIGQNNNSGLKGGTCFMSREDYTNPFPMTFTGENTLVVRSGKNEDWRQILRDEMKQLDANGKTVVITDSYIFQPDDSTTYKEDLADVLKSLSAKEIIFTSYAGFGPKAIRNYVKTELENAGIIVKMKPADIHDRYWVCKENGKVMTANSPNGIGKRTSSILLMPDDDAKTILQDLTDKKVFEDEKEKQK